jgi:hypothetical protein
MAERFDKSLPYLNGYLQEMGQDEPVRRGWNWGYAPLAFLAGAPLGAMIANLTPMPGAIAYFGSVLGLGALFSIVNGRLKEPRTDAERFRVHAWATVQEFRARSGPKRLRKSLHPAACQVLEASAFHRARVKEVLNSPAWTQLVDSGGQWKQVRQQSMDAADLAMLEALTAARGYLGKDSNRDRDWEDIFRGFASGRIEDAFESLGELLGWDRDEDFSRWEVLPEPLRPVYDVALKLRTLATELEARAKASIVPTSNSESIDLVLENLAALRNAEHELAQSQDELRTRLGG